MRRVHYLAIALSLLLSLASCGAPATPAPAPQPTKAPAAAEPAKAPATAAPAAAAPAAKAPEPTKAPAAPPAAPAKFKEAPQLAELVKQGKLPPVDQRLPQEPLIVKPVNEVGKYGGVQRGPAYGPKIGQLDTHSLRRQALLAWNTDFKTLYPNILKDYKVSDDFKSWTLTLRKGMKYSDGSPFLADDFMFWYEDILLNKDLTPAVPVTFVAGGKTMKMTKVDDVTLKVDWEVPNPNFDLTMVRAVENGQLFAPKNYLKQWHIKYNDKATELAKAEKFDTWMQAFLYHYDRFQSQQDTKLPDITPWILSKIDDLGNKYFDRNPYYWAVDTAGNQLPYIDQQIAVMVKDKDVRNLKMINQELDNAAENPLPLSDFTLYKETFDVK